MRFINLAVGLLAVAFFAQKAYAWQSPDSCHTGYAVHIVVIGSSTAAGSGANPIDSAWVPRYSHFLQNTNPENTVTNLAMGGYNTYHLLPTASPPTPNRPTPDTLRNITRALALHPDGIIINLPSNDAASGYSAEEQLANFNTIVQAANAAGVPIWVCTTQPRNFSADKIQIQLAVRDSILQRYGDFAVNFWDDVAAPDGWINPLFNSGDGVHLNNAGHRLLFNRVVQKNLLATLVPVPQIFAEGDTACAPAVATLLAASQYADSIVWFDQATGGVPVGAGPILTTPLLDSSKTYYVEARRGPFDFAGQLTSTTSSNRDWNGVMFELLADTTLVVDSLHVKIRTTGTQYLRMYTRNGALYGWENTAAGWTLLKSYLINVNNGGDYASIPFGPIPLAVGDTLSIYLHLANSDGLLAYFAPADTPLVQTPELRLENSTGISYTFSERYYPRLFTGQVFYHFGARPGGTCRSGRLAVPAYMSKPEVNLGADTVMLMADTLLLDAGAGFEAYLWSDGTSERYLSLHSGNLTPGENLITVQVLDAFGCLATDQVLVLFTPVGTQQPSAVQLFRLFPNPGQSGFWLESDQPNPPVLVEILDSTGVLRYKASGNLPMQIRGDFGPPGMYWVRVRGTAFLQILKWIKQ
ncbi:MAG: hypothetical protein H6569_09255 [Lewinellaceae bacterium]|nr:hypothetical protein [Lewinellaceae bacterium]